MTSAVVGGAAAVPKTRGGVEDVGAIRVSRRQANAVADSGDHAAAAEVSSDLVEEGCVACACSSRLSR